MAYNNKDYQIKKNTDNSEIRNLMCKYNIDEATALEVLTGVIPIELWLEKQKMYNENVVANQTFKDALEQFTPNGKLSLENVTIILEKVFSSTEYNNKNQIFVEQEEQAANLVNKHNMSVPVAKSILDGKFTLEEYLKGKEKKETRKKQALEIKSKYPTIALETCYKLIDEKTDVEKYLKEQTEKEEKRGAWYKNYLKDRSDDNELLNNYLAKLRKNKSLVAFHLYGMKSQIGIIHSYTPFEIKIISNRKTILIPKLELKYFCRNRNNEEILNVMSIDRNQQKKPIIPSKNPKKRYSLPSLKKGQKIEISMGEGEKIIGYVDWVSRFDLKIKPQPTSNLSAMIFNHSIINITILECNK